VIKAAATTLLALAGCLLAACGYTLEGKVVRGDYSSIQIVADDDPRLEQRGIPGVRLHLQSDPNKLQRETVARTTTGSAGEINIPVDLAGAGFLLYDFGLYARKQGYAPAELLFRLPAKSRRVLITLAPGDDRDLGEERDLDADLDLYDP